MELSVSSPKQEVQSPYCISDPEEQDLSEEEDDDRNHKHRRRETRSQSLERDGSEQGFTRPIRKNNRRFENGHPLREHERRRPDAMLVQRAPYDSNQRIRPNQAFFGDSGPGRGRGREYGSWNQRDSRFSNVDLSSQMVKVGSMAPSIFGGRGLSGVSNAQCAPWPGFGMLAGVPNGGIDTLHSIGLQGALRPPINSSLNMGIPRQRCRDFEDRGFCLRGDMCPMEHGINRIVVDDVQSLSQFNLPVSLPSAPLLATPSGSVPVHSVGASSTFMNSKGVNGKSGRPGIPSDGLGFGDSYPGSGGADFYDPDQPLWNNITGETSAAIAALTSQRIDEIEPMLVNDNHDGAANERFIRNSRGTSESIWGRTTGLKGGANAKEKGDTTLISSGYLETQPKDAPVSTSQGNRSVAVDTRQEQNVRKLSQKALQTLFINGIPRESNRRELLLGHFHKFGKVIDIYIPLNSEKAFIQFSKREEAEAALKAPDAVMGNRFIKLWWANRDNIPDNGVSSTPRGVTTASVPSQFPVGTTSKDNLQSAALEARGVHASEITSTSGHPKPAACDGPKVPPQQKKSEVLEQLKEELRKKQEMLEQKRNQFRIQLAKLERQASGVKGEEATEQAAKRLKVEVAADLSKVSVGGSSDTNTATASPHVEALTSKNKPIQKFASDSPKAKTESPFKESDSLKQLTRASPTMSSPMVNRYKLDNRPTAFRVLPPLPTGLADVAVLKEHFSCYGDISNVELEDDESYDSINNSETLKSCTARVRFTTRCAAEKAFANGKCWQGHSLRFVWATHSNSSISVAAVKDDFSISNAPSSEDNSGAGKSSSVKEPIDATDVQPADLIHQNAVAGMKDLEKSERNQSTESLELHEASRSCETMETGEEDSHTADV